MSETKVVPVEPTSEMLRAANKADLDYSNNRFCGDGSLSRIEFIYKAMCAASPSVALASARTEDLSPTIFHVANGTREILKLCPNGDIFVNGRLAANDQEVVDGLREWLECCVLPSNKRTEKLERALAELIRVEDSNDYADRSANWSNAWHAARQLLAERPTKENP